jgi:endo-1,4-beta-xylanase
MPMLTRRAAIGSLAFSTAGLGNGTFCASSPEIGRPNDTLGSLAAAHGRLYGCAVTTFELQNAAFAPVLAREARLLVAEYETKRAILEPRPGGYDFAPADALLQFAERARMEFRGHTLVWHKANPMWLIDALSASRTEALLTGYIAAVAGRYRGRMHSWDVVNEALALSDGRSDRLRESIWLKAFGPSYIDLAFHAARAADPHALLVYNDWGCEGAGPAHDRFRAATLDFLEQTKARGVPIGAYGMQGHLQAFGPFVDQGKLRKFIDALKALGLKLLITEHDVDDSGGPLDIALRDRAVADASRRFLDVVLESDATIVAMTWGLSDRFLDSPGWNAALKGYSPRMLPLDAAFVRKPMWQAMAASFAGAGSNRPLIRQSGLH